MEKEQVKLINNPVEDDEMEIDLLELFNQLKHNWMKIALCTILGLFIAGAYTIVFTNPVYESSALVSIRGNSSSSLSIQDLQIGAELTKDYEVIFKSRPIMETVIKDLNLDMEYQELAKMITVSNITDTRILKVSIITENADLSKNIVNAVVNEGVNRVKEIDSKEPYVVENAIANYDKVGPSLTKNLLIGGLVGLFGSIGIISAIFIISDKVRNASDVEKLLNVPVIGYIPESTRYDFEKRKKGHVRASSGRVNAQRKGGSNNVGK